MSGKKQLMVALSKILIRLKGSYIMLLLDSVDKQICLKASICGLVKISVINKLVNIELSPFQPSE